MSSDGPTSEHALTLFPLNTILFPGGPLPLRIFEPRYLKMVSNCMKKDRPFGVCLIAEGREAGEAAIPHDHGTLARIEDWNQLPDGHLGITARGGERFVVRDSWITADHLVTADIEILEDPCQTGIDEEFQPLVEILQKALPQAGPLYQHRQPRWDDPDWVAYRLAELLPPDNDFKLEVLEADTPEQRLALVNEHLRAQATQQ
ncbi:MAG: LON peptidase substrate-binding domain-containing protein [Arenicellales bacterium]